MRKMVFDDEEKDMPTNVQKAEVDIEEEGMPWEGKVRPFGERI